MTAVAIGKFDALHRGHRALAGAASRLDRPTALLTFSGMAEVLGWPDRPPLVAPQDRQRISDAWAAELETPLAWLELPFNTIRGLAPADFLSLLQQRHGVTAVAVGEDFRFGHGRSGDVDALRRLAAATGIAVAVVAHVEHAGAAVSSSRIRHLLEAGDVATAAMQLGRPHRLLGTVARGDGRGRGLGFPTANCAACANLIPGAGVYACWAEVAGVRHGAAVNIGRLPTIAADRPLTVEAHLLDYAGDCYDQPLALDFIARLRDEQRFASLDALKHQLAQDVDAARAHLGRCH